MATVEHIDLAIVLKVLRALSGETDLENLIATILRLSLEHGAVDRGLLLLPSGEGYRIEAEASVGSDGMRVDVRQASITSADLPASVFSEVLRTRETVLLEQASGPTAFSDDEYMRRNRVRSVVCLPLLKQAQIVGVIYLENRVTPRAPTSGRIALLEVLAAESATSLANAHLYRHLREREGKVRRLVEANVIGIFTWHTDGRVFEANEEFLRIIGHSREDLNSGRLRWSDFTLPEWRERDARVMDELKDGATAQAQERELLGKDGSRVPVLTGGTLFYGSPDEGVAFVVDLTERKRAEQAVREREREAGLIVDSIPGLVALLAPTGDIELVNRQVFEYFGQTLEELRQWATNDTIHFEDRPSVIEVFSRALASGRPYEIVQRFRRSDGVYRWFTNRGFPVRGSDGYVVRWCVLLTDIDDLKRAEDAIRGSERNLALIINTIPALAWSARLDGSADFFNQHYLDFIGLAAEQARGWGWTAAVHPDDLDVLAATWQRIMASQAPGEIEARLRRCDGVYRWFLFRANPLRDEAGTIVKWYGVNTDIEDRRRAEVELRRAYDSFADAQRLSQTGSFITDLVGDDHNWSEEAFRIFEFEPGSKVSVQRIRDIIHPDDLSSFESVIARGMTGENVTFAFRIVTATGAVKHVRGVAHVVEHVAGHPLFVGALQDVTDSRLAEEALDRARSELAHVSRVTAVSAFTASIAHEVNQPLSGIITNAGTCLRMLAADPPDVDGARETAKRTLRDGNRASDVIARLRTLYSRRELTLEPLDINETTREVLALSLTELQRNHIVVRSEFAADLPGVTGDRIQLQQVILNLLRNASDAMMSVHDRPRHLVIATRGEGNTRVRVTVRDVGVGLDAQSMNKLFDAFFTTKSDGMGIGLSVSRSIIERHHGRLWAEANDGPGATFAFAIPAASEAGATASDTKV
jgi:PAS domain S-box-containing protein